MSNRFLRYNFSAHLKLSKCFFDSPIFFVFLIAVVLIYWRLQFRQQNIFLLLASYLFYGWWDWRFLLLMIASTTLDYLIAHAIARATDQQRRKQLLILSLVVNFGILGIFKYFNFFVGSFAHVAHAFGGSELPVSFWKELSSAAGHFVLYVSGNRIHRRCLQPKDRAG